ncbi:MAG: hypothetical protein DI586_05565 [Micavibrio aeruginosavorus]|uniref:SGNH hydrolase-type esterase domain-containing protein n=1 Tax=Micavibrio aeruginosavorus TaxID=349221 RepID=A0A2W5HQ60_9BACT|nr:MAG: hypothetical protein DI586_05565 [Micavibrio aeruginosavorus]
MQARATATLTELKRTIGPYGKPLHVTVTTVTPGVTTSNNYINAAGQTPRAGFETGGLRDQYNNWLKSLVGGGLVDACLDIGASIEDTAAPGRFISNGTSNYATTDGIHPTAASVGIMSPMITSWAQGLRP